MVHGNALGELSSSQAMEENAKPAMTHAHWKMAAPSRALHKHGGWQEDVAAGTGFPKGLQGHRALRFHCEEEAG